MASTYTHRTAQREYSTAAVGLTIFAAVLMIITGVFHAIQGTVALINDTFFVVGQEYVFEFDVTTWGWVHLVMGLVVAVAGFGLFTGSVFARTIAVIIACLSTIVSFLWIPYYPIWSLIVVAFNLFVIWAVTVHGRDVADG